MAPGKPGRPRKKTRPTAASRKSRDRDNISIAADDAVVVDSGPSAAANERQLQVANSPRARKSQSKTHKGQDETSHQKIRSSKNVLSSASSSSRKRSHSVSSQQSSILERLDDDAIPVATTKRQRSAARNDDDDDDDDNDDKDSTNMSRSKTSKRTSPYKLPEPYKSDSSDEDFDPNETKTSARRGHRKNSPVASNSRKKQKSSPVAIAKHRAPTSRPGRKKRNDEPVKKRTHHQARSETAAVADSDGSSLLDDDNGNGAFNNDSQSEEEDEEAIENMDNTVDDDEISAAVESTNNRTRKRPATSKADSEEEQESEGDSQPKEITGNRQASVAESSGSHDDEKHARTGPSRHSTEEHSSNIESTKEIACPSRSDDDAVDSSGLSEDDANNAAIDSSSLSNDAVNDKTITATEGEAFILPSAVTLSTHDNGAAAKATIPQQESSSDSAADSASGDEETSAVKSDSEEQFGSIASGHAEEPLIGPSCGEAALADGESADPPFVDSGVQELFSESPLAQSQHDQSLARSSENDCLDSKVAVSAIEEESSVDTDEKLATSELLARSQDDETSSSPLNVPASDVSLSSQKLHADVGAEGGTSWGNATKVLSFETTPRSHPNPDVDPSKSQSLKPFAEQTSRRSVHEEYDSTASSGDGDGNDGGEELWEKKVDKTDDTTFETIHGRESPAGLTTESTSESGMCMNVSGVDDAQPKTAVRSPSFDNPSDEPSNSYHAHETALNASACQSLVADHAEQLSDESSADDISDVTGSLQTDQIDHPPTMLSDEELYAHKVTFMKKNPTPMSLSDVYDEFLGLGNFKDIPREGGISSLLKARKGGRPFPAKFGGYGHGYFKSVVMFVDKMNEEASSLGVSVRPLIDELDEERRRRSTEEDPWAWSFLKEYVEYDKTTSKKRKSPELALPAEQKSLPTEPAEMPANPVSSAVSPVARSRRHAKDSDVVTPPGSTVKTSRVGAQASRAKKAKSGTKASRHKPYIPSPQLSTETSHVEETAFLFHDPPDNVELQPLPPPSAPPSIPPNLACRWSYDTKDNRILRADFTHLKSIPEEDENFLRHMLQYDYIAVVCAGMLNTDDSHFWTRENLFSEIGRNNFYHKYRLFTKVGNSHVWKEQDGYLQMRALDYMRYLKLRDTADLETMSGETPSAPCSFAYTCNSESCLSANAGKCAGHIIEDVRIASIYMTDVELPTFAHLLSKKFHKSFKLSGKMLPGGDWCIMKHMTPSSCPFMGPNLYVSPSGGFTHVHQDGHGGVDSGHLCLTGYNEVLLMQRLTERHKQEVVNKLNRTVGGKFSPLYHLPHDDKNEKPPWMNAQTIEEWNKMNYVAIPLILKPGEFIHLGKGRLHAFRKLTRDPLPVDDCHYELRKAIVESLENRPAPTCTSIAWDWNFFGFDPEGINREVATMVETTQRCRLKKVKALAPTGRAVLQMGSYISDMYGSELTPLHQGDVAATSPDDDLKKIARGILPSLRYVAEREASSFEKAKTAAERRLAALKSSKQKRRGHELYEETEADIQKNPMHSSIDARGNDYYCKLCETELANVYYRCNGCERLHEQDYMICTDCYVDGTYLQPPGQDADDTHHVGFLSGRTQGRCNANISCIPCPVCNYGSCCSCRCHSNFTMHMRSSTANELRAMVQCVATIVGDSSIAYANATLTRLQYGADPDGPAYDAMGRLAASLDPEHCRNVPEHFIREAAAMASAKTTGEYDDEEDEDIVHGPPANAKTTGLEDDDADVMEMAL